MTFDQLINGVTAGQMRCFRSNQCLSHSGCTIKPKLWLTHSSQLTILVLCESCLDACSVKDRIDRELTTKEYFTLLSYY